MPNGPLFLYSMWHDFKYLKSQEHRTVTQLYCFYKAACCILKLLGIQAIKVLKQEMNISITA